MADNDVSVSEKPLTTGEWFVTVLILGLPIVGLVMHFVWAFGTGNIGRRNFCRAVLLWMAVAFGLAIIFVIVFVILGGTLAALLSQGGRR